MAKITHRLGALALVLLPTVGCASAPAAPFDTLSNSNLTAFRLQNYEPPAQAAAPTQPGAMLPGVPPEVQQWIQAGAAGLQQLIPPGLLPPGLLPPGGAQPAQPQMAQVPRFPAGSQPNFRILAQTPVSNPDLKERLAELLGDPDSFDNRASPCEYSEMGLSFGGTPGGFPNDVLISFSCNRVIARNFAWPHPRSGMTPDTVKELASIVQELWPPGT
jgi:hypothetical protein